MTTTTTSTLQGAGAVGNVPGDPQSSSFRTPPTSPPTPTSPQIPPPPLPGPKLRKPQLELVPSRPLLLLLLKLRPPPPSKNLGPLRLVRAVALRNAGPRRPRADALQRTELSEHAQGELVERSESEERRAKRERSRAFWKTSIQAYDYTSRSRSEMATVIMTTNIMAISTNGYIHN